MNTVESFCVHRVFWGGVTARVGDLQIAGLFQGVQRRTKAFIINTLRNASIEYSRSDPIRSDQLVLLLFQNTIAPLSQFCRCLGKDLRVLVDVHSSRVRTHQGHVVEGRQQHPTVQRVEVQEAL